MWERAIDTPILSTHDPGRGAWEATQIYAPYLLQQDGGSKCTIYYNANSGKSEQSGIARLAHGCSSLPGIGANKSSEWQRDAHNPVIANGKQFDTHQAADPKVYFDADLEWSVDSDGTSTTAQKGAWVLFYFGTGPDYRGASIDVAFSADGTQWTKASKPLYLAGGHPQGLDSQHAHKNWVFGGPDGVLYMFYTAAGSSGRGIALLTSKPIPGSPSP